MVEHTIFRCSRWDRERLTLEDFRSLNPGNIVEFMVSSEFSWRNVSRVVESILKKKTSEERML